MDLVSYCMLLLCGFAFLCMVLSGSKHSHEYYIGIARKIAGTNPILQRSLENFPAALAPCADKEEFLSTLRCAALRKRLHKKKRLLLYVRGLVLKIQLGWNG
ncbi:hypothetical protein ACQ4WP_28670 [Janthinobacterium sp. GB4P2]|uniref:hypothetical protein n=1 Tax=Janthinobacterium sp. GB4P2 TaxID=3424189 RepID=UPI003F22F44C